MSMITVTLKDGSQRQFEQGTTLYDVARSISERLAKEAVVGEVNGAVADLSEPLDGDAAISLYKFEDEPGADSFRHTSSHILAQAVLRLFPGTKLAIGPAIDNGYYYDFDSEHVFKPEDLALIEKEMQKIVQEDLKLERFEMPREEAIRFMAERGETYKVELIQDLPEDAVISFYKQGSSWTCAPGITPPPREWSGP